MQHVRESRATQRDVREAGDILQIPEDNVQARLHAAQRITAKGCASVNLASLSQNSRRGGRIHCSSESAGQALADEGRRAIDAIDECTVAPAIKAFTDNNRQVHRAVADDRSGSRRALVLAD